MMAAREARLQGLERWAVGVIPIVASVACGDTFGQSRLRLHTTADATVLWERNFDVERVYVPSVSEAGELLVLGADDCWGRDFVSEYDRATGEKLRDLPPAPLEPLASYDPPARCPAPLQRVTLATGGQVDICYQGSGEDMELALWDVVTGALRATFPAAGLVVSVAGEYLFLRDDLARAVDVVALERAAVAWRWESADEFTVLGADGDRAYLWEYERDVHALALADGAPVWRNRLRCNWITLVGDALACDQILEQSSCRDTDRLFYLGPSRP